MSGFWKGTKCLVEVHQRRIEKGKSVPHLIATRTVFLDTDTMATLFEEYPPEDGFCFMIIPEPKHHG